MFLGKKLPQGWLTGWGSTQRRSAPSADATRNRLSHFLAVPWNNYSISHFGKNARCDFAQKLHAKMLMLWLFCKNAPWRWGAARQV